MNFIVRNVSSLILLFLPVLMPFTAGAEDRRSAIDEQALKEADSELNAVYKDLMAKLPSSMKDKLREAENAWIKYRDLSGELGTMQADDSPNAVSLKDNYVAELTRQRTAHLKGMLSDATARTAEPGVAGVSTANTPAFKIVEKQKVTDSDGTEQWLAVLQLQDPEVEIPLMWEIPKTGLGLSIDRETLRVVWLEKNSLLWVSWRSDPAQGSGSFTTEMHLIESIDENKAKDLLLESFFAWGKAGVGNYQSTSVEFLVNETAANALPRIKRRAVYSNSNRDFRVPVPLSVSQSEGGGVWRQFSVIEETEYVLEADSLKEISTTSWIDLAAPPLFDLEIDEYRNKQVTLTELADFLSVYTSSDRWMTPEDQSVLPAEREKMIKSLTAANPGINNEQTLKGLIKIPTDHPLIPPMPLDDQNPLSGR